MVHGGYCGGQRGQQLVLVQITFCLKATSARIIEKFWECGSAKMRKDSNKRSKKINNILEEET